MSRSACIALAAALLSGVGRAAPFAWCGPLLAGGAVALALSLRLRGRRGGALVFATLVLLGAARGAGDGARLPAQAPAWPPGKERSGWIEARVLDACEPARAGLRTRVAIERSTLGLAVNAPVLLRFAADFDPPGIGACIRAFVQLHAPAPPRSPGGFDEIGWAAQRHAVAVGAVRGRAMEVREPAPRSLLASLQDLRQLASRRLAERVPGDGGEFLRGLLLGERGRIAPESVTELRRAGVLHLLALSGQHVAIVASLLGFALRAARVGDRAAFPLLTGVMWGYALLTGSSPSVLRATVAATHAAWAQRLGRKASGADTLAWSVVLCLVVAPSLSADLGFQLSCGASVGLMGAAAVERAVRERLRHLALVRLVMPALSLSLATAGAQLAVLPLLALRFGATSVVGGVANLVLVPACGALLCLALPLLALDLVLPTPAAAWTTCAALAGFVLARGHDLGSGPGAMRALALGSGDCLLLYGMGAIAAWAWIAAPQSAGRVALVWAAAGLWLGAFVVAAWPQRPPPPAALTYWVLDVGQGDAQVLEFADGRVLLVDTGDARGGSDSGADVIVPFLRTRRIRALDAVVITHEDHDHAGGWPSVAREISVHVLASGGEALRALQKPAGGVVRRVSAGDTLCTGEGYRVRVLWPPAGETGLAANERSVVLAIEVGEDVRVLLTGDADSTIEQRWLARAGGRASVLKLGHHGSRRSTGDVPLAVLAPDSAVVSCGRRNRFGHPHAETIARLVRRGIGVRRTDLEGTIVMRFGAPPRRAARLTPAARPAD